MQAEDEDVSETLLHESEGADFTEVEVANLSGDVVSGKLGENKLRVWINIPEHAFVDVEFPDLKLPVYVACKVISETGTCGDAVCAAETLNQFRFDKHCNPSLKYGKMVCCDRFRGWAEKGYYAFANIADPKQHVGDVVSGKTGESKIKVLINAAKGAEAEVELPEVKKTKLRVECQAVTDTGRCGDAECSAITQGQFGLDMHCNPNSMYRKMVCCRKARGWEELGDVVSGNRGQTQLSLHINMVKNAVVDVSFPEVKETKEKIECAAVADTGACGDEVCKSQTGGSFPISAHCNEHSKYGKMVCCRKV